MKKFFTLLITLSLVLGPVGIALAGHFYYDGGINIIAETGVSSGYSYGGGLAGR